MDKSALIKLAVESTERASAPYSKFRVGVNIKIADVRRNGGFYEF